MVVYRMHSELQKGGLPTMAEGFTAILVRTTVCFCNRYMGF